MAEHAQTALFPLGPVDVAGAPPYCVAISEPGRAVDAVWAGNWTASFESAAGSVRDEAWFVPRGAEVLCALVAGRGRDLGPAHAIKLARWVGQAADSVGFEGIADMPGYGLMRAMARFAASMGGVSVGRTITAHLEFAREGRLSMLAGAIVRDDDGARVCLAQDPDALRTLVADSFQPRGSGLPFVVARVGVAEGTAASADRWNDGVGAATELLFETPFHPSVRAFSTEGGEMPLNTFMVRAVTLALLRASGIVGGADVVDGEISLHDGTFATEMSRFEL